MFQLQHQVLLALKILTQRRLEILNDQTFAIQSEVPSHTLGGNGAETGRRQRFLECSGGSSHSATP
jgi:hypothetical protein